MSDFITFVVEPLSYPFMLKALFAATISGLTCSLLSCFVTLKGWSLLGDAISHSVLPGVVLSYAIGVPFALGAFGFGLASVLLIGYIGAKTHLQQDAIIGLVFTGLFGFGLVLISRTPSTVDLNHILFGNILGISTADIIQTITACAITIAIIAVLWRTFMLYVFDPMHSRAIGLNVTALHYTFLVLLSLTCVAALQTVGIVLVVAMLITPGATAFLLTTRFPRMLAIAVTCSVTSCLLGTYASYWLDVSAGGAIVSLLTAQFFVAFLFAPRGGILPMAFRSRRHKKPMVSQPKA